jgi:hypothetical protein
MRARPNGCCCTRTSLGALLPSVRGDRSKRCKARAQKTRRGNEEVRFEMVGCRPHPEERACRRRSANSNVRMRVSKDEDEALLAPSCFETHRGVLSAGEAIALGTRCAAPQHEGDQDQPAGVRNNRLCFRPVIYRENCNSRVSASPRRQNRLGRSRRRCARAPQRPSRIHTAATLPRRSKSPIKPAKTGSTPMPRTTLASRVRSPNQSSP